ncbi:MAG: hypothetical protein F7C07_02885 [Desulfurococcales archaeon]|nr:hypothetical protein [Desulfurococcales archaeon]
MNPEELKRRYTTYKALAGLLLFVVGLAAFASADSYRSHFIVAAVVTSVLVWLNSLRLSNCRNCSERRVGEIAVQGGWLWTSFSLAYASIVPAKIYGIEGAALALVEAISVALLLGGAYFLLRVKKETGAALTI